MIEYKMMSACSFDVKSNEEIYTNGFSPPFVESVRTTIMLLVGKLLHISADEEAPMCGNERSLPIDVNLCISICWAIRVQINL